MGKGSGEPIDLIPRFFRKGVYFRINSIYHRDFQVPASILGTFDDSMPEHLESMKFGLELRKQKSQGSQSQYMCELE